jgi:hypothetical protein
MSETRKYVITDQCGLPPETVRQIQISVAKSVGGWIL